MDLQETFDGVLAALSHAALDDTQWPAAAALIEEACRVKGHMLVFGQPRGEDELRIFHTWFCHRRERRADWERDYYELYHPLDPRPPRLNLEPDSRLVHVSELYTDQELKTSPIYNEVLPGADSQDSLNVRMDGPDGANICWALADPIGRGGWESEQTELIRGLLPHVRQYVRVRDALAGAEALGTSLAGLLDATGVGVLHLDRRGRIAAANDRAVDLLQRGEGLHDREGFLGAWLPAENSRLQMLLAAALPTAGGHARGAGSMTIQRRMRPRLGLHVTPVFRQQAAFGADRRVAALVLVVDPARGPRIEPRQVAALLGLSPAESRVAALLAEGRSVREIGAVTGWQESYVRWLLRHIYKKQGLSGQVALVRLVLSMTALPGFGR